MKETEEEERIYTSCAAIVENIYWYKEERRTRKEKELETSNNKYKMRIHRHSKKIENERNLDGLDEKEYYTELKKIYKVLARAIINVGGVGFQDLALVAEQLPGKPGLAIKYSYSLPTAEEVFIVKRQDAETKKKVIEYFLIGDNHTGKILVTALKETVKEESEKKKKSSTLQS